MPYTPSDRTPNKYKIPILRSVICKGYVSPPMVNEGPQGIITPVIQAVNIAMQGPRINSALLEVPGINSSFINIFTPSANGCKIPNGPALLGPILS